MTLIIANIVVTGSELGSLVLGIATVCKAECPTGIENPLSVTQRNHFILGFLYRNVKSLLFL